MAIVSSESFADISHAGSGIVERHVLCAQSRMHLAESAALYGQQSAAFFNNLWKHKLNKIKHFLLSQPFFGRLLIKKISRTVQHIMLIEFWLVDAAAYGAVQTKSIAWQCFSCTAHTFGPSVQLVRTGLTLLGISICFVRTLHSSLSGQSVPSCSAGRPSRGHHWVS